MTFNRLNRRTGLIVLALLAFVLLIATSMRDQGAPETLAAADPDHGVDGPGGDDTPALEYSPAAGPETWARAQDWPAADPGYPVPPGGGSLDGPITDDALQRLLDQGNNLEPQLRIQLVRMASQILYADLAAVGVRELATRWPQLWPAGPPVVPAILDLHLHAVSARTHVRGGYEVLALYSGIEPKRGDTIDHEQVTIRIESADGHLMPLRPT